jgi:hypothetical protein
MGFSCSIFSPTSLQHLQAMDTSESYIFGLLMIEDNTGASLEVVEKAPDALDKFSTSSIADPMIRNWTRLVRENVVLMV